MKERNKYLIIICEILWVNILGKLQILQGGNCLNFIIFCDPKIEDRLTCMLLMDKSVKQGLRIFSVYGVICACACLLFSMQTIRS